MLEGREELDLLGAQARQPGLQGRQRLQAGHHGGWHNAQLCMRLCPDVCQLLGLRPTQAQPASAASMHARTLFARDQAVCTAQGIQ